LQPGAKNPLPLSGLWKSDDERFPLRWKRRPNAAHAAKVPSDTTFQPAYLNSSYPYPHALAQVDDLCSIRITIHNKDAEAAANRAAAKPAIVPNKIRLPHDPRLFQHERLSEALEYVPVSVWQHIRLIDYQCSIEAPKSEKLSVIDSLLNTHNDIPKSTPLIEFRIYYKSRSTFRLACRRSVLTDMTAILQSLKILPSLSSDTKPAASNTTNPKASSASLQPSNPSSSQQNHITARRSTESAGLDVGPAAKRVKREESEKQLDHIAGASHDPTLEESFAIPPPLAASSSYLPGRAEPSSVQPTTAQQVSHSSNPQPTHPLSQATKAVSTSQSTPSAMNSPASGNILLSQSTSGGDRKSQARAFLCELQLVDLDDEDVEETEEMVQALLSAGFSKKQRFLTNMKACDQATRDGIFTELRASMGALNFGVLLAYLKKNCGFE
jgi:hypothetical protein